MAAFRFCSIAPALVSTRKARVAVGHADVQTRPGGARVIATGISLCRGRPRLGSAEAGSPVMEMFWRPVWLFYGLLAAFLSVLAGVGLAWFMGIMFGVVFALLPVFAWITKHPRAQDPGSTEDR